MSGWDLVILLGLGAALGGLTTIAGLGGGLLIVGMAAWFGPHAALAISAPALLLGHGHRMILLRRELDPGVSLPLIGSLVVVALLGSLVVVRVDEWLLRALLVPLSLVALVEIVRPPAAAATGEFDRRWLIPGGAGAGLMLTCGGAGGMIAAPVLRRAGLGGDRLVAVLALAAFCGHLARSLAYGWTGTLDATTLLGSLVLGLGLVLGNLQGRRLAARMSQVRRDHWLRFVIILGLITAVGQNLI